MFPNEQYKLNGRHLRLGVNYVSLHFENSLKCLSLKRQLFFHLSFSELNSTESIEFVENCFQLF